jgi:hypothetical protein
MQKLPSLSLRRGCHNDHSLNQLTQLTHLVAQYTGDRRQYRRDRSMYWPACRALITVVFTEINNV